MPITIQCPFYRADQLPQSCSTWRGLNERYYRCKQEGGREMNMITVRWFDGYLEEFAASEVRFGCDLLWMRLVNGQNRHIPLRLVRWFGMSKESH